MRVIISQQSKKLTAEFHQGKLVEKYRIDKAEEFLVCVDRVVKLWQSRQRRLKRRGRPKFYYPVDKLLKKRHTVKIDWKKAKLEFHNTGILTERVIRAIMLGLCF